MRLFKHRKTADVDLSGYATKTELEQAKRDIQFLMTKLNGLIKVHCYNCKKVLVPNMNPVYTNFQGRKFCSHECIDTKVKK